MRPLADGRLWLESPAPHVARLTLDAPEKRNALDLAVLEALAEVVGELEARCLILTGAGTAFSAGYDLAGLPRDGLAERAEALIAEPFQAAVDAIAA